MTPSRPPRARAGARPAPTNCQHEPSYPNHATVCASLRYPDLTAHRPSARCAIQEPHTLSECGEFGARAGAP